MCPMDIPISDEGKRLGMDYSQCLCQVDLVNGTVVLNSTGFPRDDIAQDDKLAIRARYENIKALTGISSSTGKSCYICANEFSPVVLEPCPDFDICNIPGIEGFRPATTNTTMMCNTQTSPSPWPMVQAYLLQTPTVLNRTNVNIFILVLSTLYTLQFGCAALISYAYFRFKDKYSSDWGKLSPNEQQLGICAKFLPNLIRFANIVSLVFLIIVVSFFFNDQVCWYDLDSTGRPLFYPTMNAYIMAMVVVWIFFCFIGSLFHRFQVRDTSFYVPSPPQSEDSGCCASFGLCIGNLFSKWGP